MAEPGDPPLSNSASPQMPERDADHDDLIGFSSAAALQGRPRVISEAQNVGPTSVEPEPDLFDTPDPVRPVEIAPISAPVQQAPTQHAPVHPTSPSPIPSWAIETPVAPGTIDARGRRIDPPNDIENASSLYAVYALILFAVPTLGVSALIALLAVTGRAGPSEATAASHFFFQQRTLWTGAVAALLGAILIAVGLGVFVLFAVAVWLILRGASGVLTLKAGRPVRDPRGWFLA